MCQGEEVPEALGCFAMHLRSIIYQASLGQMAGALRACAVTLLLEQTTAPNRSPEAGPEGPLGRDRHPHSRARSSAPSCSSPVFCLSAGSGEWQPSTRAGKGEQPSYGVKGSGARRGTCDTHRPRGSSFGCRVGVGSDQQFGPRCQGLIGPSWVLPELANPSPRTLQKCWPVAHGLRESLASKALFCLR